MQKRNRQGQFIYKPFKRSNWSGLILLLSIMAISAYLNYRFQPLQATLSPCPDTGCVMLQVKKVEAAEPILETYGAPTQIVDLIVKYFGDEAQNALKIVGTCENGKWNPTAVNQNRNGSWDAGIFQINSVHGYSQEYLFNPENNIKVAKKIFDGRGWTSWSCSHVLNIKSFWQ